MSLQDIMRPRSSLLNRWRAQNFVGMSYIIGSWYKRHELGKRFAIFACAAYAGSMFSGYIMSAIHATMEGKNGLSGWRWLFMQVALSGCLCDR